MTPKLLDFTPRGDERGSLVALEDHEVGFAIRRVYHIFHTASGVTRGLHAHRDLRQVAVAVTGSCTFLLDDGRTRRTVVLDSPVKGLVIESMIWREMFDFSPDCVLMVLASHNYDEGDYVRDYEQFRREASAVAGRD
jgi:dTDP-4-dehydrorhamnose 3,5-epimerase-like enzyme